MHVTKAVLLLMVASLQVIVGAFTENPQQVLGQRLSTPSDGINAALKKAGIIPDVLDDFDPSVSIILSYPSSRKYVDLGNKIKPQKVGSPPNLYIDVISSRPSRTTKPEATYILALTDPDATSRSEPVKAQMCHWIVANISIPAVTPGLQSLPASVHTGADQRSDENGLLEIESYFPPAPPPKTGYHRYVFVLLQSSLRGEKTLTTPRERPHWGYGKVGAGVREWASENDLEVVGSNFFYSRNKEQ